VGTPADWSTPCRGRTSGFRRWARSWMERHPTADNPDGVVLAMTEMASNSVRHGAGPVDVDLSAKGLLLLLQVSDCSDDLPRQLRGDHSRSGGRGMIVVDGVASRWLCSTGRTSARPSGASFSTTRANLRPDAPRSFGQQQTIPRPSPPPWPHGRPPASHPRVAGGSSFRLRSAGQWAQTHREPT
jgi:hypothetical protein